LGGAIVVGPPSPAWIEAAKILHGDHPGIRRGGHASHGFGEIERDVTIDPPTFGAQRSPMPLQHGNFRGQLCLGGFGGTGGQGAQTVDLGAQMLAFGLQPSQPHTQTTVVIDVSTCIGDQPGGRLGDHGGHTQTGRRPVNP
jgi:hypothetical protein